MEAFDEIFTTYTTLLIMNDRVEEALDYLDKANSVCDYLGLQQAKGKVMMMSLSLRFWKEDESIFANKNVKEQVEEVEETIEAAGEENSAKAKEANESVDTKPESEEESESEDKETEIEEKE